MQRMVRIETHGNLTKPPALTLCLCLKNLTMASSPFEEIT